MAYVNDKSVNTGEFYGSRIGTVYFIHGSPFNQCFLTVFDREPDNVFYEVSWYETKEGTTEHTERFNELDEVDDFLAQARDEFAEHDFADGTDWDPLTDGSDPLPKEDTNG